MSPCKRGFVPAPSQLSITGRCSHEHSCTRSHTVPSTCWSRLCTNSKQQSKISCMMRWALAAKLKNCCFTTLGAVEGRCGRPDWPEGYIPFPPFNPIPCSFSRKSALVSITALLFLDHLNLSCLLLARGVLDSSCLHMPACRQRAGAHMPRKTHASVCVPAGCIWRNCWSGCDCWREIRGVKQTPAAGEQGDTTMSSNRDKRHMPWCRCHAAVQPSPLQGPCPRGSGQG